MHISRITNCDTQEVRSEVSVSDYNKPNLGPLFYKKSTVDLAKQLLGKTLVRVMNDGTLVSETIVETEAYLGVADRSCHCFGGRKTPKTEAMFMSPGTAYVYNIYFHYCCFNMSSDGKLKFLLHTYSFCDLLLSILPERFPVIFAFLPIILTILESASLLSEFKAVTDRECL